jgi:hypothetical protein
MANLLEKRAKVVSRRHELAGILEDVRSDVGGRTASEMTKEFIVIEEMVGEIQSYGCIVKNFNAGLLDFLAERDGRPVYLCWRFGEPRVEFYHELHTGFRGRQRI